jgi:hypothetical protein
VYIKEEELECFLDVRLSVLPDKKPEKGMVQLNEIYYLLNPTGDLFGLVHNQFVNGGWPILGNNFLDLDDSDLDDSDIYVLLIRDVELGETLKNVVDYVNELGYNIIGGNDYKLLFNKINYLE